MPEEGCSIVYGGHQGRDREFESGFLQPGVRSEPDSLPGPAQARQGTDCGGNHGRGSGATNNRGFDTLTPTEIEVPSVDRHHRVDEVDEPPPRKNYRRRRSPPFCRTGQFRWGSPDYISGERASLAPLFKPITEFVPDSPLEEAGFEPSVPRAAGAIETRALRRMLSDSEVDSKVKGRTI
jgi:hypothetical protein